MLQKGNKVRIKELDQEGIIIEIKDGFVQVNVNNKNEWHPVENLLDANDELINKIIKNTVDDGLEFILGIDAYRLLTEYKFNPYVLASSTKIRIFPHQIDEVTWALENPKIMIADEVGLGKTIIAALVASELRARGLANKMLFVVPKSLVLKWQDELDTRFEIQTQILDSSYVKADQEPFEREEFCYVTSMDFLKQAHIQEKIKNCDLVVIDEAHKFKIGTERLDLGKLLAEKTNFLIFLTATPHDGRDEDFMARIHLLNPYVADIAAANFLWARNIKEDVVDIQGRKVFPPRKSETVNIEITRKERLIHEGLDSYISKMYDLTTNQKEVNAVRFLSHIFRKRGTSSLAALKISLKRRLDKLGTINLDEVLRGKNDLEEADEEFDGDFEDKQGKIEGYTTGQDIDTEKQEIKELIKKIEDLQDADSKLEVLQTSINKMKTTDPKAKVIIFTEYRDTLEYLQEKLGAQYTVDKIDGSMDILERKATLTKFSKNDGPEVLLCTDAAGEGIDMQFCNIEINYDLPWNPNKLEQRMGRIHRIGQTREVLYNNYVVDKQNSIDGYILSRLLDKIENIKAAMGEKIYDIIGIILLTPDEIAKLYKELLDLPRAQWEAKVTEALSKIDENRKRILEKSQTLLSGHRLDRQAIENITEVRKNAVDKGEVKRFLQMLIESRDGKFMEINKQEERYKIFPPVEFAQSLGVNTMEGTFDSEMAQQKGWPYFALGNKEINKMIAKAARPVTALLLHPTKSGLLCIYKISIIDGKGRERNSKILGFFHNDDGKVTPIDPRSIWDYNYGDATKNTAFIANAKNRIESELQKSVDEFHKETSIKLKEIEKKSRDSTIMYFSQKLDQADQSIAEYQKKRSEGPHIEKLITQQKNKKEKLSADMNSRLEAIKHEFSSNYTIDLIGMATIQSEADASIRREVELAGMNAVIGFERKRAHLETELAKIIDVSERDVGYDVESFDRLIEVKSFKTSGSPSITSHEWETARRLQNDYWLYIVENSFTSPKIHTIQNPHEKFKNSVRTEEVIDVRYILDDWKSKI